MLKKIVRRLFRRNQNDKVIQAADLFPIEATNVEKQIRDLVMPYTMTSQLRVWALLGAVKYIVQADIEGAFVECGVWRGGSSMAMACQLKNFGDLQREIWLYDTFQGMTSPTQLDIEAHSGQTASTLLSQTPRKPGNNIWCLASREDVENNLLLTDYPKDNLKLVEGDVLKTLDDSVPERIALLRLDTDWYESTKKELELLFPKIAPGGVCIVDDYGHWRGAKKAVDEYLADQGIVVLMNRIDDTGRIFIKT